MQKEEVSFCKILVSVFCVNTMNAEFKKCLKASMIGIIEFLNQWND